MPKTSPFQTTHLLPLLIALILIAANPAHTQVIAIVIDTSGSMKDVADELVPAVRHFINDLPSETVVGLVTFDVFSRRHAITRLDTKAARDRLLAKVEELQFKGAKTNFDEAIKGAQSVFWQAQTDQRAATLLLFSDGISDPSVKKKVIDLATLVKGAFPAELGVDVYLIGLSEGNRSSHTDGNITFLDIAESELGTVLSRIQKGEPLDFEVVVTAGNTRPQAVKTTTSDSPPVPKTPMPSERMSSSPQQRNLFWLALGLLPVAFFGGYVIGCKRPSSQPLEVAISSALPADGDNGILSDPFPTQPSERVFQLRPGSSASIGDDNLQVEHWIPGLTGTWTLNYQSGKLTLLKEDNDVNKTVFDHHPWE